MTHKLVCLVGAAALSLSLARPALSQISSQPTQPPQITADTEEWYLSGAPISFGGNVYYPTGPITHFLRNEMVRTGSFENTPVYVRTTQEPGSIIYVPLAGGVVRPYERRRAGDLAGTTGSRSPSFPVVSPSEEANRPVVAVLQAPAPPTGVPVGTSGYVLAEAQPLSAPAAAAAMTAPPTSVGTTGTVVMTPVRTRVQTVQRPIGLNNVFVEYQNARWFAAGAAVEFAAARFTRIGELRGFPVYEEAGRSGVIYLSLVQGTPGLVAPYKRR